MRNNDTLRNFAIAAAVFFGIMVLLPKILPPRSAPLEAIPSQSPHASSSPVTDSQAERARSGTPSTMTDAAAVPTEATPADGFIVVEADAIQEPVLGSAPTNGSNKTSESPYRMRLTLSNVGASIDTATMTDHAEEVGSDARYTLLSPVELADGSLARSLAIERIDIDDTALILHDKMWHAGAVRETDEGQTVEFWIEIIRDDVPVIKLTRSFTLPKQPRKLGRHDLATKLSVENLSPTAHHVVLVWRGAVGIRQTPGQRLDDRYIDFGVMPGGGALQPIVDRKTHTDVAKDPRAPVQLYRPTPGLPDARFSWGATDNTYFTCTTAPLTANGQDNPDYLAEVSALDLDGSAETNNDTSLRFVTGRRSVPPGGKLLFPSDIYLGEKDGDAFREVPAYVNRNYYFQISQGFGMCTFTFLVELMIRLLNGLNAVVHDYGLAIIILVVVVRLMLHPITKKGQVNMVKMQHKMQVMAPKIEEIRKKYANDKARLNQEMMKLNINPAGQILTCLPMFIQMPIWVALFLSLSNNIGMRHEAAFWGMTWINDLTAPDALYTFASPFIIPLLGWEVAGLNLLPVLVSVFMYTQQKLQPKPAPSPNQTDQQKQQQDMMKMMMPMMSGMMLIIFYNMPSGLNLYIMSSSLFGTIEQHRIRKHIKEREAAGTLYKPDPPKDSPDESGPRKSGKPSFMQRIQSMADEAQKSKQQQPKRQSKRKARR